MADLSIPPNKKKDLLSLKTTKIITSRLSRPAVYMATRRTFAAHDIHCCTVAGARTRAQHACTSDFAIFSRAMGSFCLAWLPTMYRKYQKIHEKLRSMFLELQWGCLISARGTPLLCGCRVLKRALLAEKSFFFSAGHPQTPRHTTPSHPLTPLVGV